MDLPTLVLRILKRFKPREGWVPLLLILTALLCPVLALAEDGAGRGLGGLFIMTILGLFAGLWAARHDLPAHWTILAAILGAGLAIVLVGRLVPPISLVLQEIGNTVGWISHAVQGEEASPLPFTLVGSYLWNQINAFASRLWWWSQTASAGGVAQDNIVLVLLATWLAWLLATFASWQVFGLQAMLVGLAPSGVVMATIAFFRGGLATFYLVTYLFCTLCLVAIGHLLTQREQWDRTRTDYPGELGLELTFMVLPSLSFILILAAIFPVIHSVRIGQAFWQVMEGPWSEVEEAAERLFGPMEQASGRRGGPAGILPRQQLLGAGPDLGDSVVFYVTSNDPPPLSMPGEPLPPDMDGPRRYWRGVTYDTYTGQGWTNAALEQRPWPQGKRLSQREEPDFELIQQFELLRDEPWLYAANEPVQIDHDVLSSWRGPDDLAWLESDMRKYRVISYPLEPSIGELEQALPTLSAELAERYLALPDRVPKRVLDLTQSVVAGSDTAYERAEAIEYFLRSYTYTLDLPAPPANGDVVDYFLFEQQAGYCDYYASSMVVMARAAGIPARLASGYAEGTYDYENQRWIVTEKDAHSWVEVYFDGIGWVEFEPTAGLPALTRSGTGETKPSVPPLPERMGRLDRLPWALLAVVGVLGLLVAALVWIWWPKKPRDSSAADLVRDRYHRLTRWGPRLGLPLRDGQTPLEYGQFLRDELGARQPDSAWSPVRRAAAETPPGVSDLMDAFVRVQYAAEPITDREGWYIQKLWARMRKHLWWLWLGRR
jgi:transglutaminase-like putative cysteine protease